VDVNDDPESPDAAPLEAAEAGAAGAGGPAATGPGGFDLTPRTGPADGAAPGSAGGRGRSRRLLAVGALVGVLAALGFVLFQGLNDAATFFYNVDEAVEQRDDLAGDRFRMQGNVIDGSVVETPTGVEFTITYNGVEVPVVHTGTPPELFGPDIPVVIEGTFEGDGFASDEILIRHDNTYDEENPDRIAEAERDAQALGGVAPR
jgi:cytochrome c-type biogenesis protein CcmE